MFKGARRISRSTMVSIAVIGLLLLGMPQAATSASIGFPVAGSGHDSSNTITLGTAGWRVQSSAKAKQSAQQISAPGYDTSAWLPVKPDDGDAPGTEINALLQNGGCPHILYSTNMRECYGTKDKSAQFKDPWWFRTEFSPKLRPGQDAKLTVNGVVGQADVWVNGTEVATQQTVQGDYTHFTFDVSTLLKPGKNVLALKVYRNDPDSMYTVDDVNWNQTAPDNNTGIQFPITLHIADALSISNAHVVQDDNSDVSEAKLTAKADVTNNTDTAQQGVVSAQITPPGGQGPITVQRAVTVPAKQTQTVAFAAPDYPQLDVRHPQVWWPYQMGAQPIYQLRSTVVPAQGSQDSTMGTFAIRRVSSELVGKSAVAPDGARLFSINGKPFSFRGGGFDDQIFLHYSSADLANQIEILKSMGLNGIRLEGHVMPEDFYRQMDRAGIMIDGGFQCCDAWQLQQDPSSVTDHDYDILQLSALTIGQRLRNHPSVINYSWSDENPLPRQESVSLKGFAEADFQEPLISSAEYKSSPKLGPSGEKEGPYQWVPPNYYYDTTHVSDKDPSRTNVGGAWAFDSEEGIGHTVSTMDSLKRFLSPQEQAKLWQDPAYNQYHTNTEAKIGNYGLGNLYYLDQAIEHRYGKWSNLAQYVQDAQVQNYESTRSQFEAFIDHWNNKPTPATGLDFWMANKGWPTLLYTLYNYDYDQAGAYFGAKKANEGVHALYTYDNNTVTLDNMTGSARSGLSLQAKVYSLDGKILDDQTSKNLTVTPQGVNNKVLTPKVPAATSAPTPAQTYFVELTLRDSKGVIDRNVYWRSTQDDTVDWPKTVSNTQAAMTQYADLSALHNLPAAKLKATAASSPASGGKTVTKVTIQNTSAKPTVGFFLRTDVRRGTANGQPQQGDNEVRPSIWSDNDITLWPGESQTIEISYPTSALNGAKPVVTVSGCNVPEFSVPAPATG